MNMIVHFNCQYQVKYTQFCFWFTVKYVYNILNNWLLGLSPAELSFFTVNLNQNIMMFVYFLGAEFVQNQLTGKQASKSDLEKSMTQLNAYDSIQWNLFTRFP